MICLVDEGYQNIQKSIVTRARKMCKKMFLDTPFRTLIFFVIIFIIVPSKWEIVYILTDALFRACLQVNK